MAEGRSNVSVPMKLEAYRLNAASANGPSRLAPLFQPDYTRVRLDKRLSHDILGGVDLQNTARGPEFSSRVTNIATGKLRRERFGMYLHWVLPRFYRTGITVTDSSTDELPDLRAKHGHPNPSGRVGEPDAKSPSYRPLPPRWIIVRHLTSKTPSDAKIPTFQAFVVESDRLSKIRDFGPDVDIEVEASPFAYMENEHSTLVEQAELYIGHRQHLDDWQEAAPGSSIVRVPLDILSNVNPVFADYQPHNTNVFSILDNFSYEDSGTKYLEKATANYYVMGWHPYSEEDPFFPPQQGPDLLYADRLKGCYMQLAETKSEEAAGWLKNPFSRKDPTKVLIHGALYQVEWDLQVKPPTVPADDIAEDYNKFSPVSVGVSPVDALLAITHAHALSKDEKSQDKSKPDPLAQDILSLQTLIIKQDEDPDAQLHAADILFSSYFIPADGGQHWHVAGADSQDSPTIPDDKERDALNEVNRKQGAVDLCLREAQWIKWQIWAEWWKWVRSNVNRTEDERSAVRDKVNGFINRHELLVAGASDWKNQIQSIAELYKWEMAALPRFTTCRDPTVLLCGIKSGWPTDWTDLLKVRLDSHIIKMDDGFGLPPEGWDDFKTFASSVSVKMPADLQKTCQLLLEEFYVLQRDTPNPPPPNRFFPLYHDLDNSEAPELKVWRDRWNAKQPWFPLFVEWEIEYYHIDHKLWVPASRGPYSPPRLHFEIKEEIKEITDTRRVSGRSLVLPHSNTMLKNMIEKLLKNKNNEKDLTTFKNAIDKLDLLTLTLSSISGQLATKQQNTHLKPTVNVSDYGPLALQEAVDASQGAIDRDTIRRMMYDTAMTPYADFPNFHDAKYSPFKPVIHGQFRFTKLNVIDKFGQAISAIDPNRGAEPNLRPYISEFLSCTRHNLFGTLVTRAVIPDKPWQCVQLEPRINQESRLNGHYVLWSDEGNYWRPVTEYENPIWGWLVVNYVDNGIQVFLPDGTFYREIRMGGHNDTVSWLPFGAQDDDPALPKQLRILVKKLRQEDHFREFFNVMVEALDATMSTPNHYAGYLPAVTGKPFALANSGWSLQLSHPPDVNHSTTSPSSISEIPIESYQFQVKFGDKDRSFDGLVGYFKEKSPTDMDLDKFYTEFPVSGHVGSMTINIKKNDYPILGAFYNDPVKDHEVKSPEEINLDYNQKLQTFGMLVDPFTPVHAFTGFLPAVVLHLPDWSLEQGLKNITAFFRLGPMVMPYDAPTYDPDRALKSGSNLKDITDPPEKTPPFPIPAVGIADWTWLQPYAIPPVSHENIKFNPFKLSAVPREPKLEVTPYTAVEGFLYLKQPITSPPPNNGA